jgi:hypothetical protein
VTLYHPLSTTIICSFLFHIFVIIVIKSLHQYLLIGGWAPLHSPLVVFLLFAHLPRLPLHFLPHQNGTPSSVN